jgi:ABC-2 type transport system ATP-binding protein
VSAISLRALTKRYGTLVAVDDLTLEIERGELFVLLGPNGAGKTTTIEIALGLREPDEGTASVLGSRPGAKDVAPRVGAMPQQGDLYTGIRTEEAVRLFASFYEAPEDPSALIDRLDLGRVRRSTYRQLSGGERRRLSLALALVGRPDVAFLDEPTAEMDVEGRATTWEIVRELKARGTTVILTTHLLDEAERVADRVGIMHHGRLVAVGPPRELGAGAEPEVTFTTTAALDTAALAQRLGANVGATGNTNAYRVTGRAADEHLVAELTAALAESGALVRTLHVGARSLEEVYLELTGGVRGASPRVDR